MTPLIPLIVLLAAAQTVTAPDLLRAAEDAFSGQRYQEALDLYDQLRERYPQQAEIPYNMGVTAYRQGDLQRAAELFNQARMLAGDPALRARSAYNLGTTAYRKSLQQPQDPAQAMVQLEDATSDLEQALEHFREAIDADPADLDARANGELAYRWLEQLQEMQQQMQQQQGQQQQSQDQPRQDQQQQGQSQQEQQEQAPQPSPDDRQQQEQQAGQAQPGQEAENERDEAAQRKPMTREEAQRLLQQVRDKERRRQEQLARREAGRRPPVDKDW